MKFRRIIAVTLTAAMVGALIPIDSVAQRPATRPGQRTTRPAPKRPPGKKPNKRVAVLIGIDQYKGIPAARGLKGAVNDVRLTRDMLVSRGYAPILTLTNSQATTARIRRALATLGKGIGPKDKVYFHFSGFGHKPGAAPVLCAYDYNGTNGIAFKEVETAIKKLKTSQKAAVVDCSFVNGAPTKTTMVRYWPGASQTASRGIMIRRRSITGPSTVNPAVEQIVKSGRERKWLGALTWNLVRSNQTATRKTKVRQLSGAMAARAAGVLSQKVKARDFVIEPGENEALDGEAIIGDGTAEADGVTEVIPTADENLEQTAETVNDFLDALPPDQEQATFDDIVLPEDVPGASPNAENLENQIDDAVFQDEATPDPVDENAAQLPTVEEVNGDTVTLDEGASMDLTPGTTLEADTNHDGTADATIELTDVGIDSATGKIVDGEVPENTQFDITKANPGPGGDQILVEIAPVGGADASAVAASLGGMSFVKIAAAGDVPERRLIVNGGFQGKLVAVDVPPSEEELAGGVSGGSADGFANAIKPYLVNAYLMKRLLLLSNPNAGVNVNLRVQTADGQDAMDGVKIGTPVRFSVEVDKPAYITLLQLGSTGSVTVLLPNDFLKEGQQAQPGQAYTVPNSNAFRIVERGPAGKNMVIAVASTKPLDMAQFQAAAIPNLGGLRSIPTRNNNQVSKFAKVRDFVVEAVGGDEQSDEWGSSFIIVPVFDQNAQ